MSDHPAGLEPTTLAVYVRHVSDVLARTSAQVNPAAASVVGTAAPYGSILDALAQVDPKLADLPPDFETEQKLAREVRDATAAAEKAAGRDYRSIVQAAARKQRSIQELAAHQAA